MSDGVNIDTDGVASVGKDIRSDAQGGFADAAQRASVLHGYGVEWGTKIYHGPIAEAKDKYAEAIEYTEANLRTYPKAAAALADVAEQIARDFANADMSSSQTQAKIESLITGAITNAKALADKEQANAITGVEPWEVGGQ
jgi:hypothetical protein